MVVMTRGKRVLAALAPILLASLPIQSARAASAVPGVSSSLSDWGLHCWCLTARRTPQRIIRADNNGRLLQLAVGGITRAELDRKLPGASDSQLTLLQTYGLLSHDG